MSDNNIQLTVDKAVDKAVDRALATTIKPAFDEYIKDWEVRFDKRAIKIAEDAANFVYEKQKHDFGLVLEATDFIKQQLDQIPTRQEFNDLRDEVRVIRHAVKATNKDVRSHDKLLKKFNVKGSRA